MRKFWKHPMPTWFWVIVVVCGSINASVLAHKLQILDLPLAVTLVIVEVPLGLIGSIIIRTILNESRQNAEETKRVQDKEIHTQNLNGKIFSRLVDVEPRIAPHIRKLMFMIPRHYDKYQAFKKDAFLPFEEEDLSFEPIQALPKPLFDWGMEHLESYDEINKSWKESTQAVDNYNLVSKNMEQNLRQKMIIETSKFTGFQTITHTEESKESNLFDANSIFRLMYSALKKKSEGGGDPTFDDLELQNIDNVYHVIIKRSGIEIFSSPQIISLEKTKEFLFAIYNDKDLQALFQIMEHYRKEAWDETKKFTKLLSVLVSKIDEGMSLEGKCELGY